MSILALSFALGVLTAIVWCWRFYAVEHRRPLAAALWDGATMALAYAPFQLWANAGDDWRTLLAFIAGNMVGTALTVWRNT